MAGVNEQRVQLKNSVDALIGGSGPLLPILTDLVADMRSGVEAIQAWSTGSCCRPIPH